MPSFRNPSSFPRTHACRCLEHFGAIHVRFLRRDLPLYTLKPPKRTSLHSAKAMLSTLTYPKRLAGVIVPCRLEGAQACGMSSREFMIICIHISISISISRRKSSYDSLDNAERLRDCSLFRVRCLRNVC